jgi:hypothetical protein
MLNFDKHFFLKHTMNQLEVFNKIGGILKELNDQYKYLEANPAELNELELELFVANAHFLADHSEILSKLNLRTRAEKPVAKKQEGNEKYFEPVVQQPVIQDKALAETSEEPSGIEISAHSPEDTYSFIREEPEIIRHELVIDETEFTDEEIKEDEPLIEEEKTEELTGEPPPLKEEVKPAAKKKVAGKEEIITINQKISSGLNQKGSITAQAGAQPVTNLKNAITLNEKLLYIKDLFRGYSLAYSEAIEILNRFNTFEEAERFLNKNYVTKNDWESKPDTTEKFYELLKRRYS